MTTADEFRTEIERLKSAVLTEGRRAVSQGLITEEEFRNFVTGVGVEAPEDEETRAAREELEAYQLTLQRATRSFLPTGKRDEALRLIGCPVPTGRVGTL